MWRIVLIVLALIASACGAESVESSPPLLRDFEGNAVDSAFDAGTEPVHEARDANDRSNPSSEASQHSPDTLALASSVEPGAPSVRCDTQSPVDVVRLAGDVVLPFVVVAPSGILDLTSLSRIDDAAAFGHGVVVCIDEAPFDGEVASCGITANGSENLELTGRSLSFRWLSAQGDDLDPYISPSILLFGQCPDLDESDPLFHPAHSSLPTTVRDSLIDNRTLEDALEPSLFAFGTIGDAPLTPNQCSALSTMVNTGEQLEAALAAAYGSGNTLFPGPLGMIGGDDAIDHAAEFLNAFST